MLELTYNDQYGKKVLVQCAEDDTIGDLKTLIAAQTGTRAENIGLKKCHTILEDHLTAGDYGLYDGMNLELYGQ